MGAKNLEARAFRPLKLTQIMVKKTDEQDFGFFSVKDEPGYGWIISCSPAVVVLPVVGNFDKTDLFRDLIDLKIGLIQIYRPPISELDWEFPGGSVDDDEDPIKTAYRELREETGIRAKKIDKIGEFFEAPGRMLFLHHVFVAESSEIPSSQSVLLQEKEGVRQFEFFTPYEIDKLVENGKIVSGPTLAALGILRIWLKSLNFKAQNRFDLWK